MKQIAKKQTKKAGMALTAAVAFAIFGSAAMAAPPADGPAFASADISIERRGEDQGALNCSWRETGLGSYAVITYECNAAAVGVLEGCFLRNKLVLDAGTELSIATGVSNVEQGHDAEAFISRSNGTINDSIITAIPEAETPHGSGGGHLCTEPLEQGVIAVRWCEASLWDTENDIEGAHVDELYREFTNPGQPDAVPSCTWLLAQ